MDHNIEIDFEWASRYFMDRGGFDLHLTADSPAVDAGSQDLAPAVDRDGIPRPQGPAVDIGAYEWYEGDPVYPDDWDEETVPEPRPDAAIDVPPEPVLDALVDVNGDITDEGAGDTGEGRGCSCSIIGSIS